MENIFKQFGTVLQRRFGTSNLPNARQLDSEKVKLVADVERPFEHSAWLKLVNTKPFDGPIDGSEEMHLFNSAVPEGGDQFGFLPYADLLDLTIHHISHRVENTTGTNFVFYNAVIAEDDNASIPQGVRSNIFDERIVTVNANTTFRSYFPDLNIRVTNGRNQDETPGGYGFTELDELRWEAQADTAGSPTAGSITVYALMFISWRLRSENQAVDPR